MKTLILAGLLALTAVSAAQPAAALWGGAGGGGPKPCSYGMPRCYLK